MLKYIAKKIFGKKDKEEKDKTSDVAYKIKENSKKLSNFFDEKINFISQEINVIREKTKDLRSANYDIGYKHMESGRITDAIIRFRIIKKVWPDFYEAYYNLAYCLMLKHKPYQARAILIELLEKEPDFDPIAQELLDYINQIISDAE